MDVGSSPTGVTTMMDKDTELQYLAQIERQQFERLSKKIVFALDVSSRYEADLLLCEIASSIGMVKIGLEAYISNGRSMLSLADAYSLPIFLDLKLHDIPTTVDRAVAAAIDRGVRYITVHCQQESKTLEKAVRRTEGSDTEIVGVSLLSSMTQRSLEQVYGAQDISLEVFNYHLITEAIDAGIRSFVCSGSQIKQSEMKEFRSRYLTFFVPGIRMEETDDDQAHAITPKEAIANGADYLIIGRPIRDAKRRVETIRKITSQMS